MPKGIYKTPGHNWSEGDDELLADSWGRISDKAVARRLGRTVDACKIRATRHLGLSRTMNLYTAREVGRIFGVDSKAIIRWAEQGYLKARRSSVGAGKTRRWDVDDASIERLIQRHPWFYDRKRIDRFDYTHWRNLAEEAWRREPYLTAREAAARLGLNVETVRRHCRRGWVKKAYRVHWLGNDAGTWLIAESSIKSFEYKRPSWLSLGCIADRNRLRRAS